MKRGNNLRGIVLGVNILGANVRKPLIFIDATKVDISAEP